MRTRLFGLYPFDGNLPATIAGVDPVVVAAPGCASATRDVVKCDVRNATQAVNVPGTPLTLAYTSARAAGAADRTLDIPITGSVLPAGLLGMYVHVTVAGQTTEMQYLPAANVTYHYQWDGLDAYGRAVQGNPTAVVELGHLYVAEYQYPAAVAQSFGLACSGPPVNGTQGCRMPQNVSAEFSERHNFWRVSTALTKLGGLDAKAQGLGGFDFNVHHQYDPVGRVLYLGDGTTRVADAITPVMTTVAGNGLSDNATGDGGPAVQAKLAYQALHGIAALPDGRILATNAGYLRIVGTDGIITRFAGWARSTTNFSYGYQIIWDDATNRVVGENGLKDSTYLTGPQYPVVGTDGTIFLADNGYSGIRLLRITPDGRMTRVAGARFGAPVREGIRVTDVQFGGIGALAVDGSNTLYFVVGQDPTVVYRVGADSVVHVFAGNGQLGDPVEGGQAAMGPLRAITSLAAGPDGSVYIGMTDLYTASMRRISKVTPDGMIRTFVGGGTTPINQTIDRRQASFAQGVAAIAVSAEGLVYFTDGNQVLAAGQDGSLRPVAMDSPNSAGGFSGDGGPALRAKVNGISALAVGPDGTLLIADFWNARIRKVAATMPGFTGGAFLVASEDGSELYSFDAGGRHLQTIDAVTRKPLLTLSYSGFGHLVGLTDRNGERTLIERDALDVPIAIVGPSGYRLALFVDAFGNLATATSSAGLTSTFGFSEAGRLLSAKTNMGASDSLRYDATGKLESLNGEVIESVVPIPLGSQAAIRTSTGLDVKLTYGRDLTGTTRVVRTTNGVQSEVITFTDGSTETHTPNGTVVTTRLAPDPRFGMQAPLVSSTITLPSGLSSTQSASASVVRNPLDDSEINVETDSLRINGRLTYATFDHLQKRAMLSTPLGRTRTLLFDDNGQVIADSANGLAALHFERDANGNTRKITKGTSTWLMDYDAKDNLTSATNPLGRTSQYQYDATGALAAIINERGDSTSLAFDAMGRLTSVRGAGGRAHRLSYTDANQLGQYEMPDVGFGVSRVTSTYNVDGHRTLVVRANGDSVHFAYDSGGRQVGIASNMVSRQFIPDVRSGLLAEMRDGANRLSLTYDGSLVTRQVMSGEVSGSVSRTYGSDFMVRSQAVGGTAPVSFHYDAELRVDTVGALAIGRDVATGLPATMTLGTVTTRIAYNALGSVDTVAATASGTALMRLAYARDSIGRIVGLSETMDGIAAQYRYGYDAAGQLEAVAKDGQPIARYEYDRFGNRNLVTTSAGLSPATYDARDRLVTSGSGSYSYTADGFLKARVVGNDTTSFVFDEVGGLRGVRLPTGRAISYVLDAMGRRTGRRVNGRLDRGWVFDGTHSVVAQLDSTGTVVMRFVYGEREDVPSYVMKNGRTYRYLLDHLGSVRLLVDVTDGSIAQRIDYDAFGRVTSNSAPGFQPFAYAGGLYDDETGLSHFGAREYDAATGRWISKDPILFTAGEANLYTYVGNDPINQRDPSGYDSTIPEEENVIATQEELEKGKVKGDLDNRRRALKQICDLTQNLASKAQEVHHVVFKVFDGGDGDANFLKIPFNVHRQFHLVVNGMLKAEGLEAIQWGNKNWMDAIQKDPATKAQVREILLNAASDFDTWCSQFGTAPTGGPRSMRTTMEKYMIDAGWM